MKSLKPVLHFAQTEVEHARRSGINYVCSRCGSLLYHVAVEQAHNLDGIDLSLLQPLQVASRLVHCPNCGHRLRGDIPSSAFRIKVFNQDMTDR